MYRIAKNEKFGSIFATNLVLLPRKAIKIDYLSRKVIKIGLNIFVLMANISFTLKLMLILKRAIEKRIKEKSSQKYGFPEAS